MNLKKTLQILGVVALSIVILKLIIGLLIAVALGGVIFSIKDDLKANISNFIVDSEDGEFQIKIKDDEGYDDDKKSYSNQVNITSKGVLIIKNNDTIVNTKKNE